MKAIVPALALVCGTAPAISQECSAVLSQGIYDVRSTEVDLTTASSYSQWFCDKNSLLPSKLITSVRLSPSHSKECRSAATNRSGFSGDRRDKGGIILPNAAGPELAVRDFLRPLFALHIGGDHGNKYNTTLDFDRRHGVVFDLDTGLELFQKEDDQSGWYLDVEELNRSLKISGVLFNYSEQSYG